MTYNIMNNVKYTSSHLPIKQEVNNPCSEINLKCFQSLQYDLPHTFEGAGNYFSIIKTRLSQDRVYITMESFCNPKEKSDKGTAKWFDKGMLKSLIDYLSFVHSEMK